MKKILFCASTSQHLRRFHLPYLRAFRQAGWQVWAASGSEDPVPEADRFVRLPLEKRLLSGKNAQAVLAARRLLARERFDCVSVHTTLAAAAVRLAARAMKQRPKIFYTCHGYLFSESDGARSAPYLLAEKLCAPVTDVLMVMNREDREIARRHRLCGAGEPRLIPGMGVDLRRYAPWDERRRLPARGAHGYTPQDFVLVYAAEFSARKNHALLLRAFAAAVPDCPGLRLLLAGEGALRGDCERLAAELGISGRVRFAGEVREMEQVYGLCDASVTTSRSEGLPFNVMEAMAAKLPVAATRVKGHEDLIRNGETGLLFDLHSVTDAADAIRRLYHAPELCEALAETARRELMRYALPAVLPQILSIYRESFPGEI